MLGGVVVASESGTSSLVFYLVAYAFMNLAAFAVIVARERETVFGDDIRAVRGLGAERPALAWALTISMLALAGLPAAAGAALAADDLDAGSGGAAGDGGLHRKALPDRGPGRRRLHLARRLHRRRHDDLARLLPAGGGGDLGAAGRRR